MIALLCAVSLGAAPVDVIVSTSAKKELVAKLKGARHVDASALHEFLFEITGPIGLNDFSQFKAKPAAGWPKALDREWQKAMEHCRTIAGPLPWNDTLAATAACSKRMAKYLWQIYLEALPAKTVWLAGVSADEKKHEASAYAGRYSPGETVTLDASAKGTDAEAKVLLEKVLTEVFSGGGAQGKREVVRVLVEESNGDPFAGQAVAAGKVGLKKSCDALPSELSVKPDGVLAQSLAGRWKESAQGSAPPATCQVTFQEHEEDLMGTMATIVNVTLKCGAVVAVTEVAKKKLSERSPVEMASAKLVQALGARYCP